ncbi:hypothetical protein [Alteribacillus bidgolensis]|nr:hypothetical protein [Alteribacillus bidgolensis]
MDLVKYDGATDKLVDKDFMLYYEGNKISKILIVDIETHKVDSGG